MIFSLIQLLTLGFDYLLKVILNHYFVCSFVFRSFISILNMFEKNTGYSDSSIQCTCNQRARHWSQNLWLEFRPWTKYEWIRKVTRNITSHLQRNEKEKRMKHIGLKIYIMPSMIFWHRCLYDFAITEGYTTYYILRLLETPGEHLLISLFFKWRIGESHAVCKVLFRQSSCKVGPEYSKPVREKLM